MEEQIAPRNFGTKEGYTIFISVLLITDLAILLDIPYVRQILGFLFLTLLPGLLILQILKLNKIETLEKFVLSWGLSISFLMFFGLLMNNLSLGIGYETPLATIPLLVSFNIIFSILAIFGYKINKREDPIFFPQNINLTTSEKAFLIVPILFPALSIFGMHVMNTTDNNIILMILLFLIPIYVAFVCYFNQKFSKRLYPVVIFLISISLLLLMSLRSDHIIGIDAHLEYYSFQFTLDNLHWTVLAMGNVLDACLCISILPTIYQSILNQNTEFLYKVLYSLLYTIIPLVIYIISRKYVEEVYAFLASCIFMFQTNFLTTAYNARANIAVLFLALAMMTLFNDRVEPLKKRLLFIVFMASCVVSHYSTAYIFFLIMLGAFVGMEILSKRYTFKKIISLTSILLFGSVIFFWYSQVTETAFNEGVRFFGDTFGNLNRFFVEESRVGSISELAGREVMHNIIPYKIQFVFTWLTFALIGIGLITLIIRYKEMLFLGQNVKNPDFLREKLEVEFLMVALCCAGLLVAIVVLPHISLGYSLNKLYSTALVILAVFFVVGGITLSKIISIVKQTFEKSIKKKFASESVNKKKASEVWAVLIILLVLIPYFLCVSGFMYDIFDVPRGLILRSEGEMYDWLYVHDQETYGIKWLTLYREEKDKLFADFLGNRMMVGYAKIPHYNIHFYWLTEKSTDVNGYIYLKYQNSIKGKLRGHSSTYDIAEYSEIFSKTNRIYDSGGSEIWR